MFLGPRKMPEMAKKIGKIMADFRNTTSEFKDTWEREVNFDEEVKSLNLNELEAKPVVRVSSLTEGEMANELVAPVIKEIDPTNFNNPPAPIRSSDSDSLKAAAIDTKSIEFTNDLKDKKNWL